MMDAREMGGWRTTVTVLASNAAALILKEALLRSTEALVW